MEDLPVTVSDVATSTQLNELFGALAKAQGEIKSAVKDSENPHFQSAYADLAAVWDACRAPLSKNGLAVVQVPHTQGPDVAVTTILGHASGQWIRGTFSVKPIRFDAPGAGSVTTYLRRYSLSAITGVAPGGDDDDGEAGVARPESRKAKTAKPRAGNTVPYRNLAEDIKEAIDGTKTEEDLTNLMVDKLADLNTIKSHSESAYEFLIKRAADRRGFLLQRPA